MNRMRCRLVLWSFLVLLVGGPGCTDESSVRPLPEAAPSSLRVMASSPQPTASGFTIDISWSASQPLGESSYEWAVGYSRGSTKFVPPENLDWTRTRETAVTLSFDEGSSLSWVGVDPRSRTFYVRATSPLGMAPVETAELSFTPRSLAPEVHVLPTMSAATDSCVQSARHVIMKWEASDPDSKGLVPESVRYVLLPLGGSTSPCMTRDEYEAANPIGSMSTNDPRWSDWIPYDKHGDFFGAPGGVHLGELPVGSAYLFAVQARDKDGATSRDFEWSRSALHFRVSDLLTPTLRIVEENSYAYEDYVGVGTMTSIDVVTGQELRFSWSASADEYFGVVVAYRFGWDVVDLSNSGDPGWVVSWGDLPGNRRPQPVAFASGSHTLTVEAKDSSGSVVRGQVQVVVHPIPAYRRPVLLVDDWRDTSPQQMALDDTWDAKWASIFLTILPGFNPIGDVLDVQESPNEVTLDYFLQFQSVVWFTSANKFAYLRGLSEPRLRADGWNWLEAYQKYGGNVLIAGPGAMYHLLPDATFKLYPMALDDPSEGWLGWGTSVNFEGEIQNRGTTFWPYRGFCLEAVDFVRPAFTQVYGEKPGMPVRTLECAAIHTALIDPSFLASAPGPAGVLLDLQPTDERLNPGSNPLAQFSHEEFYNTNVTSRSLSLTERGCVTVMFRAHTRRSAGLVSELSHCGTSGNSPQSVLEDVPIGIMSGSYSATKPHVGSHDFVWGFNPMEFQEDGLARALYWVLAFDWGILHAYPKGW